MSEQKKTNNRQFWLGNTLILLGLLVVGYEFAMGRILWQQLQPMQSALAKQGIKMEVLYRGQMRGSVVTLENPLAKVEVKLSHQLWTLLTGDFVRGKVQGHYQINEVREEIKGNVHLDWKRVLHTQLQSSGFAAQGIELAPSTFTLTFPITEPQKLWAKFAHGGTRLPAGTLQSFDLFVVDGEWQMPTYRWDGAQSLALFDVRWQPLENRVTMTKLNYNGQSWFTALQLQGQVQQEAHLVIEGLLSLDGQEQRFFARLTQTPSRWELAMMSQPWLFYPLWLKGLWRGEMEMQVQVFADEKHRQAAWLVGRWRDGLLSFRVNSMTTWAKRFLPASWLTHGRFDGEYLEYEGQIKVP